MAKHTFWSRFKRVFLKPHRHQNLGFTLLELLVVTAIAGGIVSGLTFIMVQIMTSDQREASRSETQREMQMALDYISAELREASYVYPGEYLPTLAPYLAADARTNSVPVLAFWKQQPFPETIKTVCATSKQDLIACEAGQSYALVVYSLRKNEASERPTWRGKARLTRYVLSQFSAGATGIGDQDPGWADPGLNNNITSWPAGSKVMPGTPAARKVAVLVDFVSFDFADAGLSAAVKQTGFCPDKEYSISPPDSMLTGAFAGVRSFYACVSDPTASVTRGGETQDVADPSVYRDTLLFLTGNAVGRPGIVSDTGGLNLTQRNADVLPTLQTRVLSRSVLGRRPNDESK